MTTQTETLDLGPEFTPPAPTATLADEGDWIITWPCGCIGAVAMAKYTKGAELTRFLREAVEDGGVPELVSHEEYNARGGIQICKHEPQWGGVESPYGKCPRCWKRLKKIANGRLTAHKWNRKTCSQEPRP